MSAVALLVVCGSPATGDTGHDNDGAGELRIVTLSPHLAELVYTVGAGDLLVGVSAYTDYPQAATRLPVVGDAFNLDLEQLALLEPDILLAWETGTPAHVLDVLRNRGYRVETVKTTSLDDVADALLRIGSLTGHSSAAAAAAADFREGLAQIAKAHADAEPITVFYQVSARPLYTVNGKHFVSELVNLCGGVNIFADLGGLAPAISVEAVLDRDPEVVLASTDAGESVFDEWDRWTDMAANRYGNRFMMPANDIARPTPRLLIAAKALCDALDEGRRNRRRVLSPCAPSRFPGRIRCAPAPVR